MPDAGLQITISADVQNALSGLDGLNLKLENSMLELQQLERAIDLAFGAGRDTTELQGDFDAVSSRVKDLNKQISALQQVQVAPVANGIAEIAPAAQSAGASLQQLGLSTGQARVAFTDLGRIITGQGFSLRSISSNFALLGPGITIGIAALGYLGAKLFEVAEAYSPAQQATENLNRTLAESGAGAIGEIDSFTNLVAIVRDTTNAYDLREKAFSKIQSEYPNAFQNMSLEKTGMEDIATAADKVTSALLRQAQIRGLQDAISGQFKAIADESTKSGYEAATAFDKIKAAAAAFGSGGFTTLGSFFGIAAGNGEETQQENIDKYQKSVKLLEDEMANLQKTSLIDNDESILSSKKSDDLKSIIPVLEQIQRINDELAKPSTQPLFKQNELSIQANDQNSTTYQLLEAQIQEAIANGVTKGANDPRIASAYDGLAKALQAKLSAEQNPDLKVHFAFELADVDNGEAKKLQDNAQKSIGKLPNKLSPKNDIKVDLPTTQFLTFQQEFQKNLQTLQTALQKNIDSFASSIGNAFLEDLGKGIGDALSGKGLQSAFDSFMDFLGESIIKIGEQLIVAAGLFQLIDVALGSLFDNPLLAAGAGIAAIAAGEVIKNSFKAKAFATGGIVTGPTLGLIGEAGPEVVFPLDRLNQFVKSTQGGGGQTVQVVGTIRGRDIAISNKRDSKLQNMAS